MPVARLDHTETSRPIEKTGRCPHGSLPGASDLIELSVGESRRSEREGTSQTVGRDRQLNSEEARPRDAGFVETPVSCRGLDSPTPLRGSIDVRWSRRFCMVLLIRSARAATLGMSSCLMSGFQYRSVGWPGLTNGKDRTGDCRAIRFASDPATLMNDRCETRW